MTALSSDGRSTQIPNLSKRSPLQVEVLHSNPAEVNNTQKSFQQNVLKVLKVKVLVLQKRIAPVTEMSYLTLLDC